MRYTKHQKRSRKTYRKGYYCMSYFKSARPLNNSLKALLRGSKWGLY